jgi:UTP--glucose-1-phosphate uridylyltransferase
MKVRKAIIPAAGLGTRFLPATKAQPKEMLPIVDKPAIQYVVEEAIQSGMESIIIVTGKNKRSIEDHFDKSCELELQLQEQGKFKMLQVIRDLSNMVEIHTVRQKEPLGLGHAIWCARSFTHDEPFAVLLGDDLIDSPIPALQQLIDVYEEIGELVVAVQPVPQNQVNQYGIIEYAPSSIGQTFRVRNMIEKPQIHEAPSNLGIVGRYILTPDIFPILEKIEPDGKIEIQLTTAIQELCKKNVVTAVQLKGERYDIGNILGFIRATIELGLQRTELSPNLSKYLVSLVDKKLNTKDPNFINTGEHLDSIKQG